MTPITRLKPGEMIAEDDSFVSGIHPMRESDPPGFFLGYNPDVPGKPMYITWWDATEIATKMGYPMPEVYEAQLAHIDEQARYIAELEQTLNGAVNDLQMKGIMKAIQNTKKETLDAIQGYAAAVRARTGDVGSDADVAKAAARVGGTAETL